MKRKITVLAAGLLMVGTAQAGQSLSCQIKERAQEGVAFSWSHAHGEAEGPDTIPTAIGVIGQTEGPGFTTAITLNGEPIAHPPEHAGLVRYGKVYAIDDQVALAYLVERSHDSSASPSELVFLVDASGTVSNLELQPGNAEPVVGHCNLIQ